MDRFPYPKSSPYSLLRTPQRIYRQTGFRLRVVRAFLGSTYRYYILIKVVRSTDRSSRPLNSRDDTHTPKPRSTVYNLPDPQPTPPSDRRAPAYGRLISRAFSPHGVIALIEAIFASPDEVKMISRLRGDNAQIFIDVIHEVSLHTPSVSGRGLIAFTPCWSFIFHRLGVGSP